MTNRLLVTAAVAGLLACALPVNSQINSGTLTPPSDAELSARIAAATAAFPSKLTDALSPAGIKAMIQRVKDSPRPPSASITNFDDVSAPCAFNQTTALRGIQQSAAFTAPQSNGGAIVNQCGHWSIDAHSPPNFLGFNTFATYTAGAVPQLPELIVFGHPDKTSISLWVSGGTIPGFPFAIAALGPGGVQGVITVVTTHTWQQVTVTGAGIQALALIGDPEILMVDDIQATPVP